MTTAARHATVKPCQFCGFPFDQEAAGVYGCPNCEGAGIDGVGNNRLTSPGTNHKLSGYNKMTERKRLSRLPPEERRAELLDVALKLAKRKGYLNLTRDGLAAAAKCSQGLVTKRFGAMDNLRREVMRAAVARGVLEVIAQGIAARDPVALRAPAELKAQAAGTLA